MIERKFFQNLRYRDMRAEYMGEKKPEYAGRLLSRDLHLADFEIPGESAWAGKTLLELNFGKQFCVHVVSILRQFRVDEQSEFLGKTMRESGIREKYHCLIVGVERGEEALHAPDPHEPFMEDDVVWVVGEKADVYKLVGQKNENIDME